MPDRLLPLLLLLTLLDLGFVQATGIVASAGLLPLWLLTLAAPWLRRLQNRVLCRIAWNGGVLIVFALLVRHATTSGLLHMLEDGLVLAVLCQVHLLNNIGARQRPDLLFFNSLLVAFVTSFFAPDVAWSLLFVAHAFVLIAALQVNVLARRGARIERAVLGPLLRCATGQGTRILAVTAVLFVVVPRDFGRQGWLGDALADDPPIDAGLSERIRLDETGAARLSDELIAQLTAVGGSGTVPTHWRAIAFSVFDGLAWYPQDAEWLGSRFASDPAWQRQADGSWRRMRTATGGESTLRVRLFAGRGRLPLPLGAVGLALRDATTLLDPRSFGGFVVVAERATRPALEYEVATAPARPFAVGTGVRAHFLALPGRGLPEVARAIGGQLRAALPEDADELLRARAAADYLREHRRYALPGEPGFARNLGEFLVGAGAGHCEYFATALALLLRLDGVPCRVVGGWLAHETDPASGAVVVRARDAHAWVEVLTPDGIWHTIDATPPADVTARRTPAGSWAGAAWQALEELWREVLVFDRGRRAAWLQRLFDLPRDLVATAAASPATTVLVLATVALLAYRRRRRQHEPAIVAFERAVRAAGLRLQRGETPRELLHRAAAAAVARPRLERLQRAARRHERLRYGPASLSEDRVAK